MTQMNLFTKQIDSNRKQSYGNQWGETNYKFEINLYTLLNTKQVTNKGTIGNYTQDPLRKKSEKEYMYN